MKRISKNMHKEETWASRKHFLITGASSGIGREISLRLAGACGKLTMVARNIERLTSLLDDLKRLNDLNHRSDGWASTEAIIHSFDVRDTEAAANLIRWIYDEDNDQVDAFINCAGGSHVYGLLESLSKQDIEEIMDVNGKAPIFWLRELLPRMKSNRISEGCLKRAHVMMLSSRSGERALPNLAVYAAAKGSVEKLVEAVRNEYAFHRIAFTLVNPGSINTAFTARWPLLLRDAHNTESMTVEEAVDPIIHALNSQFAVNKLSYESLEQWRGEPGVLAGNDTLST